MMVDIERAALIVDELVDLVKSGEGWTDSGPENGWTAGGP